VPIGAGTAGAGTATGPRIVPAGVRTGAPAVATRPQLGHTGRGVLVVAAQVNASNIADLIFDGPGLNDEWELERVSVFGEHAVWPGTNEATVWTGDKAFTGPTFLDTVPMLNANSPNPPLVVTYGAIAFTPPAMVRGGEHVIIHIAGWTPNVVVAARIQFRQV
jgi:hypothetical protein